MNRILLVEDEKNFAMVLREYLKMNGFEVHLCSDGEEGLAAFREQAFDLCLFDIMMPKKDGFTLSREVKALQREVPVIFLTARSQREDMIRGYQLGADDYIVKPFDSELLLLKIRAVLNRLHNGSAAEIRQYRIGRFEFHVKTRTLLQQHGIKHKLSPKEAALLQLLCQRMNDVMPRSEALKMIWKEDNYFTGRSMDVFIVRLRKLLAADPGIGIENLHGNGYMLSVKPFGEL